MSSERKRLLASVGAAIGATLVMCRSRCSPPDRLDYPIARRAVHPIRVMPDGRGRTHHR